jgi:hypothetical protein
VVGHAVRSINLQVSRSVSRSMGCRAAGRRCLTASVRCNAEWHGGRADATIPTPGIHRRRNVNRACQRCACAAPCSSLQTRPHQGTCGSGSYVPLLSRDVLLLDRKVQPPRSCALAVVARPSGGTPGAAREQCRCPAHVRFDHCQDAALQLASAARLPARTRPEH